MDRKTNIGQRKYNPELNRSTTAPPHNPSTVIKYMAPRAIDLNLSSNAPGSLRSLPLTAIDPGLASSSVPSSHSLTSLIQNSSSAVLPTMRNFESENNIHEFYELVQLGDSLLDLMLQYYHYDAYNRSQELKIELCETNTNKNSSTIERMYHTEIETARQIIADASRYKSDLNKKLNDIQQATAANDEHYQQLLSRRNTTSKGIFENQRQLAQNRVESEFLRCRMQQFNDEINFYTLKNNVLQGRQVKLRYELDEEIFATQVLQMELEVLTNEKITNEDIHVSELNDIQQSIDPKKMTTLEASIHFREQLAFELRRIKTEYDRRLQTHRDELHRKFELEYHRYRMHKSLPVPNATREHEQTLEQIKREKKEIEQQMRLTREKSSQIQNQLASVEKQILNERIDRDVTADARKRLAAFQQTITEREKQLGETIELRNGLKKKIELLQKEIHKYKRNFTENANENGTLSEKTPQDIRTENKPQALSTSVTAYASLAHVLPSDIAIHNGTSISYNNSNIEKDCETLNECFKANQVDVATVINTLCNRTCAERVQIRQTFKALLGQDLSAVIDNKIKGNEKTILKVLLLSPIERDFFELRRVLTNERIDESVILEILLNRSNQHIRTLIEDYAKIFGTALEQDIIADNNHSPSRQILLALFQANRPENDTIDENEVLTDAKYLHETAAKWRQDGSTFIQLLCNRSDECLKAIFNAYYRFSKMDIEQSIQIDKNHDLSRILIAIVRMIRNRPRYFAFELTRNLKGTSSDEHNLTRIIVSRCEVDMEEIKAEFEKTSKRTLIEQIQINTSGNFQQVLLGLLGQPQHSNSNINDLELKQQLVSQIETIKTRQRVRWQQPITSTCNSQPLGRSLSSRDLSVDMNQRYLFNELQQFLSSKSNEKLSRREYIEQRRNDDQSYSTESFYC